jgi:uracil-DNA glycosylase family 4
MSDTTVSSLRDEIRACRRCLDGGFPISAPPIVANIAVAPFMVIGQAPSIGDLRAGQMYVGPAGRKLVGWLLDAGFAPDDIGTTVHMTALTLCFPGRLPGKSTDRAPSSRERANCRPWLDAQLRVVRPRAIILFGKMAIDTFLPGLPGLDLTIGRVFEKDGVTYVPLPHSSGASTWLNDPEHQALLAQATEQIRLLRNRILDSSK